MFTGIVQGIARITALADKPGLRTFTLAFPPGFCHGLEVGASVACNGVCLTVTSVRPQQEQADFDVMLQSLNVTTLGALTVGDGLNVERAAKDGAEIGGHLLSGHVDFQARLQSIRRPENNHVMRLAVPAPWMRYVFAKGYIAVDGASLTVAEAGRERDGSGWFEVWLIPETLRMTTFGDKREDDAFNVEIERQTQVFVDTVRAAIDERLGPLLPALEKVLAAQGLTVDALAVPQGLKFD
jgi:riboflavin synthase